MDGLESAPRYKLYTERSSCSVYTGGGRGELICYFWRISLLMFSRHHSFIHIWLELCSQRSAPNSDFIFYLQLNIVFFMDTSYLELFYIFKCIKLLFEIILYTFHGALTILNPFCCTHVTKHPKLYWNHSAVTGSHDI